MDSLSLIAGASVWLLLSGLFSGTRGIHPAFEVALLGGWFSFFPVLVLRGARAFVEAEMRRAVALGPRGDESSGLRSSGIAVLPACLVLGGILSGVPLGLYGYSARSVAGLWGALPVFLAAWIGALVLGEAADQWRWRPSTLLRAELWAAGGGLLLALALPGPWGLLGSELGARFAALGPAAWVSLAVEGQVLAGAVLVSGGLGILLEILYFAGRKARLPLPREVAPSAGEWTPCFTGNGAGIVSWVVGDVWRRWGWAGFVTIPLLGVGTAVNLRALMAIPALEAFPTWRLVFLQSLQLVFLILVAPEWTPSAAPRGSAVEPSYPVQEADRAWGVGLVRCTSLVFSLGAVVWLGGVLPLADVSLLLVDGCLAGATLVGLSCLALRTPSGATTGGFLYLAGLVGLIAPHWVLDLDLALIRELSAADGGPGLYLAWLLLKVLLMLVSLTLGAYFSLVYCRQWNLSIAWNRPLTKS